LRTARYFDAINSARRISVPVLIGTGYSDVVCVSSSVYAAYNVIDAPKQMQVDPLSGHGGRKPNYNRAYRAFLEQHKSD